MVIVVVAVIPVLELGPTPGQTFFSSFLDRAGEEDLVAFIPHLGAGKEQDSYIELKTFFFSEQNRFFLLSHLHKSLSRQHSLSESDLDGLEGVDVSVGELLDDVAGGDSVAAETMKDGSAEATQSSEAGVDMQRVRVTAQPVQRSLERSKNNFLP